MFQASQMLIEKEQAQPANTTQERFLEKLLLQTTNPSPNQLMETNKFSPFFKGIHMGQKPNKCDYTFW